MNKIRFLLAGLLCLTASAYGEATSSRFITDGDSQCRSIAPCDCDSASRPVTGIYSFEIGAASARATYLSPLRYHGAEYALTGFWTKALPFAPSSSMMEFDAAVRFANLLNPAQTASMIKVGADFRFGMGWRKEISQGWQVGVGGNAGFDAGALYIARNSNNLVAVQAWCGVGLTASLSYSFKIGRIPAVAADRLQMPLLGAFFMPGYTESYYEIYLGNHRNLAHFAWPGSHIGVNNLLGIALSLGRTGLEVGYRFDFCNSHANNLSINTATHSLVIGVIPDFKL